MSRSVRLYRCIFKVYYVSRVSSVGRVGDVIVRKVCRSLVFRWRWDAPESVVCPGSGQSANEQRRCGRATAARCRCVPGPMRCAHCRSIRIKRIRTLCDAAIGPLGDAEIHSRSLSLTSEFRPIRCVTRV